IGLFPLSRLIAYTKPAVAAPKDRSIATIEGMERLAKLCSEFFWSSMVPRIPSWPPSADSISNAEDMRLMPVAGRMPKSMQSNARIDLPKIMSFGTSLADDVTLLQARAKNEIPNNFTNTAIEVPIERANARRAKPSDIWRMVAGNCEVNSKDCTVSHSLTKPLQGGRPALEIDPIRK